MGQKWYIIFLMGVSGSGKSTLGSRLADRLGIPFADGDDFHPEANVRKMSAGIPLEDTDRWPWLEAINRYARQESEKQGAVIACSALKESYRRRLSAGLEGPVYWFYLAGSFALIRDRLAARAGHFMPAGLLRSQFDTLEEPHEAIRLDIAQSPETLLQDILNHLP
jgi:carbohydrate kinase (thermoresistant glucokinase family)